MYLRSCSQGAHCPRKLISLHWALASNSCIVLLFSSNYCCEGKRFCIFPQICYGHPGCNKGMGNLPLFNNYSPKSQFRIGVQEIWVTEDIRWNTSIKNTLNVDNAAKYAPKLHCGTPVHTWRHRPHPTIRFSVGLLGFTPTWVSVREIPPHFPSCWPHFTR